VPDSPGKDVVSSLIDLTEIDLEDLAVLDRIESPVLVAAVQRIHDEIRNPNEAVAGFNSCL
jgi:FXSXX-COOH protein